MYDPAMGRWWQLDPLADEGDLVTLTPYNYSFNNPIRYNDPNGDCPLGTDCGDYWLGLGSALVDDLSFGLINTRDDAAELVDDPGSFLGQDHGDIIAFVGGTMESASGAGMVEGAIVVTAASGGAALEVTAPAALIGTGIALHGAGTATNGLSNWTQQKGRILETSARSASDKKLVNDAKQNTSNVKVHDTDRGPSGKPKVHTVEHTTPKRAKDAARQGGKATPVKHTKDAKGGKHYHHGDGKTGKGKGTKDYGSKSGKRSDNVHHEYPD